MSIVSSNIKYLRKLNGMTQEQFAKRIDIKRSLLGAYEEARANPNLTNLENMAAAFGITVDNLLKNDFQKLKEKPELTLPFSASRPMTVSHSGAVSVQARKPASPEVSAIQKPVEKYQPHTNGIPVSQNNFPETLQPAPASLKTHTEESAKVNQNAVLETAQTPIFNNHFVPNQQQFVKPQQYPSIQWVAKDQQADYISQCQNPSFLVNLPTFQLPNLPAGYYRAFESGTDFAFPGALLVGSFIRNWYEIRMGNSYVFVIRNFGVVYRKNHSEINENGILTLTSDITNVGSIEVSLQDVMEVWEVKAFVSHQMPSPTPSVERIGQLVNEIQKEISKR
jgi:DNA-binding XRE family transcriptional regulator